MALGRSMKKRKGVQRSERDISGKIYKVAVAFLALGFGFLHRWHVSTLFENARHFSHLSEIEREMSFRTEMGMYYSYYKTIAESKNFIDGLTRINSDNLSEYPNVVKAEAKYNLFPEVMAGLMYHAAKSMGVISKPQCWQIERGDGLSPVTSCEGLGVPIYFYLEVVWNFATVTGVVLFLYATYLSGTIYGGLIAILSFFYNHTECTRVQWTPPLRESFAYPALLYQMYIVTTIIDKYQTKVGKEQLAWREIFINGRYIDLLAITAISLHSWQFSQFVLTTQLMALTILLWMRIIPRDLYTKLSALHAIPVMVIIFASRSNLLLCSLYTCLLVGTNYTNFMHTGTERQTGTKIPIYWDIVGSVGTTFLLKSMLVAFDDDRHIYKLLEAKLTSYKDFHTMLYTCSVEFDFLQYETYEAIVSTLLLPAAILAAFLVLYYWYRNYKIVGYPDCVEAAVAYNGLQMIAFVVMAFFIMRLKLFMTPQLCVVAGLATSKRYLDKVGVKSENVRVALVVLLVAGMSYNGIPRLEDEHDFIGEYSNVEQEELFEWIKANTPKTAVFAGKMSLMANLMLSTERPIVNNPYYENKEMRDRTLKVYEIYSRKDAATVYDTLRKMQVDYVVLEEGLCYGLGNTPPGCRMVDLWDLTDNERNKRAGRRPLCPILFRGNAHPFRRVFVNRKYVILRLDYSTYVELKPSSPVLFQSW